MRKITGEETNTPDRHATDIASVRKILTGERLGVSPPVRYSGLGRVAREVVDVYCAGANRFVRGKMICSEKNGRSTDNQFR
jgi:hypothetical protein